MIADIATVITAAVVIIAAIVGAAWKIAERLSSLETEVHGHNDRLDILSADLKNHLKDCEKIYTRGRDHGKE